MTTNTFNVINDNNESVATISRINFVDLDRRSVEYAHIDALRQSIERIEEHQTAPLYMGNPGDVDYVDEPYNSIYLGSVENLIGTYNHMWLVDLGDYHVVASTHSSSNRSTCAIRVPQDMLGRFAA